MLVASCELCSPLVASCDDVSVSAEPEVDSPEPLVTWVSGAVAPLEVEPLLVDAVSLEALLVLALLAPVDVLVPPVVVLELVAEVAELEVELGAVVVVVALESELLSPSSVMGPGSELHADHSAQVARNSEERTAD